MSDIVARVTFAPTKWLDVTYRTRLDKQTLATHFADAVASVGVDKFRVSGGYIYTDFNPYTYYDQPAATPDRQRLLLPAQRGHARRIVQVGRLPVQRIRPPRPGDQPDGHGRWRRRSMRTNASFLICGSSAAIRASTDDGGSSALLFLLTFKTIGQFGYRAL